MGSGSDANLLVRRCRRRRPAAGDALRQRADWIAHVPGKNHPTSLLAQTDTTGAVDGQPGCVATPCRGGYKGAVKALTPKALGLLLAVGLVAATACAEFRGARLYHSGTEALDRGDPTQAIADLERAAELAPGASEVRNHLGLAYAAAGRSDDAIASFEQALVLDCDNEAARRNLALARSGKLGRPKDLP